MISAKSVTDILKENQYFVGSGVPCSILTPLLSEFLSDGDFSYVAAANEAHAIGISSGGQMSGQRSFVIMQNSGFCNAIEPLTSLNGVFDVPLLLIISWRGNPNAEDASHHGISGEILPNLLDLLGISWRVLPDQEAPLKDIVQSAIDDVVLRNRTSAIIVPSKTLSQTRCPLPQVDESPQGEVDIFPRDENLPSRYTALEVIARLRSSSDSIFSTTGKSSRELYVVEDHHQNLYMVGSMGIVSSTALGFSLFSKEVVHIIDGDGSALMHLGAMATIGTYAKENLIHFILDNGVHDSTGGQPTVSNNVDFPRIAIACGYAYAASLSNTKNLVEAYYRALEAKGPALIHIRIKAGSMNSLPRPSLTPAENLNRFCSLRHKE